MTSLTHSHTESVAIAASPAAVLALVGDPEQLPRWAPATARHVDRDGEHWILDDGEQRRRMRIRVVPELGIVDYLAPDADRGAFSRVVHSGEGSEMLFTVVFGPDATEAAREATRATLAGELATVRELVEGDR